MPQANLNDLWWTPDGDFLISETGDLRGTDEARKNDPFAGVKQLIYHRLVAEREAWSLHPQLAAGLEQFIGLTVDEEALVRIQAAAKGALIADLTFRDDQIETRAMDLGQGAVVLMVWVRQVSDKPLVTFGFDIQTGQVTQVF